MAEKITELNLKLKPLLSVSVVLLNICLFVLSLLPAFKADGYGASAFYFAVNGGGFHYWLILLLPIAMVIAWVVLSGKDDMKLWVYIGMIVGVIADYSFWNMFKGFIEGHVYHAELAIGCKGSMTLLIVLGIVVLLQALLDYIPQLGKKTAVNKEA